MVQESGFFQREDPVPGLGAAPQVASTAFTLQGSKAGFTPTDDGAYRVTLTVRDGDGGTAVRSAVVHVANVAPTLTLRGTASADVLQPYTLTLSSADAGADTIRTTRTTASWTRASGPGS